MKARVERDAQGRKTALDSCEQPCAIERGMRIVGGKWTGSILWHLKDQPVRFNDLTRMIGGASKKMIAERLRHLEGHGLVERWVLDTMPVGVEYRITTRGEAAVDFLDGLRRWTEAVEGESPGGPRESSQPTPGTASRRSRRES